ncbi:MAG: class I SAM-dependent methyltransferase [Patescibacteria group bacterium]
MRDIHYKIIHDTELINWWYKVRRKIIHDLIKKYGYIENKNIKILDAGCGVGTLLKELEKYGNVSGLDFSEIAVNFCKEKNIKNVSIGNITKLPFPDNTFDIVLALDVVEHVEDDLSAMREIYRVMKGDGVAIITVPAFKFLWGITDEMSNHHRRYTISELKTKIKSSGLSIVRSSYFNTFLFIPIALVRCFVRLFNIRIMSENETGNGAVNTILYKIFYAESIFLKYINFPFGVSAFVICKK